MTTTDAKFKRSFLSPPPRPCRRQPNNCCGVRPCCRATALTEHPAAKLSAAICAFCSPVHDRRRPAPVIISRRRAGSDLAKKVLCPTCVQLKHATMPAWTPQRNVGFKRRLPISEGGGHTFESCRVRCPRPSPRRKQLLCADAAFQGAPAEQAIRRRRYVPHVRSCGEEIRTKKRHLPRRWVVEVAHSWFKRFCKLLVRYEKKHCSYLALSMLAAAISCFRHVRKSINTIYG